MISAHNLQNHKILEADTCGHHVPPNYITSEVLEPKCIT